MWKVLCLLAFVGLVVGQEVKNNIETKPNTSIPIPSIESSNATTTNTADSVVLGDKKETVVVTPKINIEDEPGSAGNPFDPPSLVKLEDDQSLGSFKYYFVLLAASSLSVIGVIIFKTLR